MPTSIDMIERLISFDTTSYKANIQLIQFAADFLSGLGADIRLTYDDNQEKANLFATIGPSDIPGIVLSGHTDVVPVDGQDWSSDPFRLSRRDHALYGRGTADMKSFIAICLALAPEFSAAPPVHAHSLRLLL